MQDEIQRRLEEYKKRISELSINAKAPSPIIDYFRDVLDQPSDNTQKDDLREFLTDYYGYVVSVFSNILSDPSAAKKALNKYSDLIHEIDEQADDYLRKYFFPLIDARLSNSAHAPSGNNKQNKVIEKVWQGVAASYYTQEEQIEAIGRFVSLIPLSDAFMDIRTQLLDVWAAKRGLKDKSIELPEDIKALVTGLRDELNLPAVSGVKGGPTIFRGTVTRGPKPTN